MSLILIYRTLSQDLHRQYNGLPDFLRWDPQSSLTGSTWEDRLLIDLHLEYLYNHFLLYRLLEKRTSIHSDKIIGISLEIMNAILSMVDKTHKHHSMIRNVAWSVCSNTPKTKPPEASVPMLFNIVNILTDYDIALLCRDPFSRSPISRLTPTVSTPNSRAIVILSFGNHSKIEYLRPPPGYFDQVR